MAKNGKMDKFKSRLGFGAGWDAEYLEEEDQDPSDYSKVKVMNKEDPLARRHPANSPYASGAAPSAVTKHVRKPDLKRVSEITGREIRETQESRRSSQPVIGPDGSSSFKPREFSEAMLIGNHLKEGKTVTVDLSLVPAAQKQRFIDFMAGLVYALDGHLARSSTNGYTLTPR
ncbi:MAG: cell division protein SepF [Coriobacteriia bacterium]|nr:cell division protein SepF [Coriobacteriia bacterium]MCL2537672.1 cell division protein SepF [Coriobacteriia bacterium]